MNPREGELVQSRVVEDPGAALASALDRSLTGYAVLEPQDALLLDQGGAGVIAFQDGVPVGAYHDGDGRGGPEALAALAVPGPYSADLYALPGGIDRVRESWRVPPGMAAERLAGDPDLADRTRRAAPADALAAVERTREPRGRDRDQSPSPASAPGAGGPRGVDPGDRGDAVAAFLADEEKIESIRRQAREQARERADEWGLTDQLADDGA